ncbi:MAG: SDR family NAD(P)-dependent oxidoreductase [Candidatus Nitrosoabyssus spongiisocia]|nr:MAG: SDR family NAD(P)-dependent oxidoreductase [Nitrosopumilaceae archaeon AB1(1)]
MDFAGKVVVITGASTGIGRAAAINFSHRGANLVLVSRNKDALEKVKPNLSDTADVLLIPCDVSDNNQVIDMAKKTLKHFGRIDILVNNAGFAILSTITNQKISDIESQMKTNYFGMIYCIKQFLPVMLERNSGHIVNVASVAGSFGLAQIAPYCASKYAMLGFSEGLKQELYNTNVDVTVVSPMMTKTNFFDHPSFVNMHKYSPMTLTPEQVARVIIRASGSSRLEIIVPSYVRIVIWLKQTFPFIINPIIHHIMMRK